MKKSCAFSVVVLLTVALPAKGLEPVEIDHSERQKYQKEIEPAPGDTVSFTIVNTCPFYFSYQTVTLKAPPAVPPPAPGTRAPLAPRNCDDDELKRFLAENSICEMTTKTLEAVHSSDVTSYQILISRNDGSNDGVTGVTKAKIDALKSEPCPVFDDAWKKSNDAVTLNPGTYTVYAKSNPWKIGMSGGVAASWLTDPVYAVVNDPASETTPPGTIVVSAPGAEDSFAPAVAGFIHAHNRNWELWDIHLVPTFGFGVETSGSLNLFAGVALDFGNEWYLNIGINGRQVDRLPAGQVLGEAPINDNVLTDLPQRFDTGFFVGFSFAFMSPGEEFFKGKVAVPKAEEE